MIVDVTRTIEAVGRVADGQDIRVDTIIADFHDTLFAFKCATSERLLRLGISMAQLNILYVLRRSGEMPMSRLAEVLNVSLSNATGLIDRMEERGFIERTRVPEDRRIVLVRLTTEGQRLLEDQDAMSEELLRRVLDRLDPSQLTVVAQATADLKAAAVATMGPLPDRHGTSTVSPRSTATLRVADAPPATK
jgi:DNA-binding MarR family transcriptional regulator